LPCFCCCIQPECSSIFAMCFLHLVNPIHPPDSSCVVDFSCFGKPKSTKRSLRDVNQIDVKGPHAVHLIILQSPSAAMSFACYPAESPAPSFMTCIDLFLDEHWANRRSCSTWHTRPLPQSACSTWAPSDPFEFRAHYFPTLPSGDIGSNAPGNNTNILLLLLDLN
jgi:hypothetical protein